MLTRLYTEESGQAMVEYGLILGFVSIVAFGILQNITIPLKGFFQSVIEEFSSLGK